MWTYSFPFLFFTHHSKLLPFKVDCDWYDMCEWWHLHHSHISVRYFIAKLFWLWESEADALSSLYWCVDQTLHVMSLSKWIIGIKRWQVDVARLGDHEKCSVLSQWWDLSPWMVDNTPKEGGRTFQWTSLLLTWPIKHLQFPTLTALTPAPVMSCFHDSPPHSTRSCPLLGLLMWNIFNASVPCTSRPFFHKYPL